MRTLTTTLALFVALTATLSAQAGPHRGASHRGGVMPTQPQAYKKPQTITPENAAVVQARQQAPGQAQSRSRRRHSPKKSPTKEQTTALYQALMAVVDGSNKPTPATVQKLSADLAAMMSRRGTKPGIDTQHLAESLKVVMNSAYVMTLDSHVATRTSQDLLKAAGTADPDAKAIVKDLETIATQAAAQGRPGMIR